MYKLYLLHAKNEPFNIINEHPRNLHFGIVVIILFLKHFQQLLKLSFHFSVDLLFQFDQKLLTKFIQLSIFKLLQIFIFKLLFNKTHKQLKTLRNVTHKHIIYF